MEFGVCDNGDHSSVLVVGPKTRRAKTSDDRRTKEEEEEDEEKERQKTTAANALRVNMLVVLVLQLQGNI